MAALWARIAPSHPADPEPWFTRIWHEHGSDIPLAALTRFVESGRSLADLDHPGRYQAYFRTCCTRLAAEAAAGPSPSRSPSAHDGSRGTTPASAFRVAGPAAGDDYRQDLRSLYLADRHPGSDPAASTASPRPRPATRGSRAPGHRRREAHAAAPREPPSPTPGRGPPDAPVRRR